MAGYVIKSGTMEWNRQKEFERSSELTKYISESKRKLKKFGVALDRTIVNRFNDLKTTNQVDEYIEKVKKDYLKAYIKEKVRILKDFSIKVTKDHIAHMKTLTSPIYIDNYVQDLIRKVQK